MSIATLDVAKQYLEAWKSKDLDAIARHVHPNIQFKGPMSELSGRESFLAACQRMFPMMVELRIRSAFESGNQAIFAYDFVCSPPIGLCRTAELLTVEDGLITSVELFFDARPFEQLGKGQQKQN